jgi:hypothetical protein
MESLLKGLKLIFFCIVEFCAALIPGCISCLLIVNC